MTVLDLAQARIPGLKKKTAKEWAGPCPECGGTDRFLVWTHRDAWHCRGCNVTGDAIEFLRKFEGRSCPEAHAALGLDCNSYNCPVADKCRKGQGKPKPEKQSLQLPAKKQDSDFSPSEAITPEQCWQQQAAKLIEKAHSAMLDCPEQVDYLTARGIPFEAIQKGKLGWLPENRYPSRKSWGLPEILKDDGKPKKMFIPAGILIPFFDAERKPHRIRIRRSDIREQDARYYWLSGSGDDVPVIGGVNHRGVVVVESDLDAFMVRWQCRDLDVSVIPLGTCSAKPKGWAMQALQQALAILVAHDFEPRHNEKTGKNENPGGQGARWWLQQFPRATRWPVPAGKDPGEYYQDHNGNIRDWILAGLPPAFHVQNPEQNRDCPQPHRGLSQDFAPCTTSGSAADYLPEHAKGETVNGHGYVVAYHHSHVEPLRRAYPKHVVFSPTDMAALKGMTPEQAELILLGQKIYGGDIEGTKPIGPDWSEKPVEQEEPIQTEEVPLPPEPVQDEMSY